MDDEHYNVDTTLDNEKPMRVITPAPKVHQKRFKRPVFFGVIVLVVLAGGLIAFATTRPKKNLDNQNVPAVEQSAEQPKKIPTKSTIRFIATGDNIAHDAINAAAKQSNGNYNYDSMFGDSKEWFAAADVRFCNEPTLAGGVKYGVTGYPNFNAPLSFTQALHGIGCNLVTVGSNHTNDKPQAVVNATLDGWKDYSDVYGVGGANRSEAEKQKVHYFEVEGVKFAFLAYTTYTNQPSSNGYSVTMYSDVLAQKQLSEATKKADVVIVSMRWGTEYSPKVNVAQKALAKKLSAMGADIIVGHGPHVLQPVEKIGDTIVWYSLGNYFNAQLDAENLFNGIAAMDINKDTKKVSIAGYLPVYVHYEWTATEKKSQNLLARKNFSMYTFDDGNHLDGLQLNTTLDAQNARIKNSLNTYMTVKILTKAQYLNK